MLKSFILFVSFAVAFYASIRLCNFVETKESFTKHLDFYILIEMIVLCILALGTIIAGARFLYFLLFA